MSKEELKKEETREERHKRLMRQVEEDRKLTENWTKEQKARHLLDKMSS